MLSAVAAVVAGLAAAGPAPAQVRLTAPSGYVAAAPHVASVAAQLELRGRAPRDAVLPVTARCVRGPCATTAVANRRGRFATRLHVVLPRDARAARVRVGGAVFRLPLDQPDYAALPPYVDYARVPELNMIGDSLSLGTDGPLRALLKGWRVTTDGRSGRPLDEGMDVLARTPLPNRPRVLAFSLFTNNNPSILDELEAAVARSLQRLGPRDCAVWATIARPAVDGVTFAAVNARLRALEGGPLRIADWARAVRRRPKLMGDDGIHPTAAGYTVRARLYARAARACLPSSA